MYHVNWLPDVTGVTAAKPIRRQPPSFPRAGTRELQRVGTRADARGRLMSQTRMNRPGGSAWAVQVTTVRVCSMRLTRAGCIQATAGGVLRKKL
jgi:hypothetical protein